VNPFGPGALWLRENITTLIFPGVLEEPKMIVEYKSRKDKEKRV
jgi:hypothetical protein